MKLSKVLMMTAVAACMAMPAMANDDATTSTTMKKGDMNSHWAMMDTNGDGKISKAEWDAAADKKFDEIDTNHDGFITKDEWAAKGKMMKHMHHTMTGTAPMSKGSTSTPADNNQAAPAKAPAAEGADGAGGATAQ